MVSLLVTWLGCQKFIKTGHTRTYHSRCDVFFCWTNVCWLITQKTMTFSLYTTFLPCGRGFECKGHRLHCPEANALIIHCTLTCTFFHHPLGFAGLIIINLSYGWAQKTTKNIFILQCINASFLAASKNSTTNQCCFVHLFGTHKAFWQYWCKSWGTK